jgi:DeoR/GlpR family transcriptional regulator of sugar metabolism
LLENLRYDDLSFDFVHYEVIMSNRELALVSLVEQRGFISVRELSQALDVSEVTIRRDLQRLHHNQRLLRTYGAAAGNGT